MKPYFCASFIQSWYCDQWSINRWHQEISMLQDVGITEVIIQSSANTNPMNKYASYPSKMSGYRSNDVDMLANALDAADDLTMKIRIGTGDNCEWWQWWKKGIWGPSWLLNEARVNISIVDEIAAEYAAHPSFVGWYLPYEIDNLMAITRRRQTDLNTFFTSIISEIHLRTPEKTVMVSPFYNSNFSRLGSLKNWTKAITHIFIGTGIDIIALQDSIGAGFNKVSQLEAIFSSAEKATEAVGAALYANNETFRSIAGGNVPSDLRSVLLQMETVRPCVAVFVAFSLSHYCDKDRETRNYLDYKNYYLSVVAG